MSIQATFTMAVARIAPLVGKCGHRRSNGTTNVTYCQPWQHRRIALVLMNQATDALLALREISAHVLASQEVELPRSCRRRSDWEYEDEVMLGNDGVEALVRDVQIHCGVRVKCIRLV